MSKPAFRFPPSMVCPPGEDLDAWALRTAKNGLQNALQNGGRFYDDDELDAALDRLESELTSAQVSDQRMGNQPSRE